MDAIPYLESEPVFDFVVDLDKDMKLAPGLATEWKLSEDSLTYEFKLRKGVKFHNGDEFTCGDVQFSLTTIMDPGVVSRRAHYFKPVESSECVDDYTFRLKLTAPMPSFLLNNMIKIPVVPADTYNQMGAEQFGITPVGTGPYRLVEWVQGSKAVLEANEDYWGGAPSIKHLTVLVVTDPSTRLAMLYSGDVDWAFAVPGTEANIMKQVPGLEVQDVRTTSMIFIGMNSLKGPFTDIRLRQAVNYAVDWDTIIQTILVGYGYRNPSSVGESIYGYDPTLAPYPYDPEKAKALLAEAGYPNGLEVQFDGPVGRYVKDKEVAEAVAGYLNEVGVTTKMNLNEWGTFWEGFLSKKIPGLYLVGCGGALDFDLCNRLHFHSKVRGIYYNTPESDAKLDSISSSLVPAERLVEIHEYLRFIQNEAPWIFAYDEASIVGNRIGLTQELRADLTARPASFSWK